MKALRSVVTLWLIAFVAQAFAQSARDLPDFTRLVEEQGPAVVNISTTQTVKRSGFRSQWR